MTENTADNSGSPEPAEKHYRTYSDLDTNRNVKETLSYFMGVVEKKYASDLQKALKIDDELDKEDTEAFFQKRKKKTQEAAKHFLAHIVSLHDEEILEEQPIDYLESIMNDLLFLQKLEEDEDYKRDEASEKHEIKNIYTEVSDEILKREQTLYDLVWDFEFKRSKYTTPDGQFKPEKLVDIIKAIETGLHFHRGEEQIEYPPGCKKKLAEVHEEIYDSTNKFLENYTNYTDSTGQFSSDSFNTVIPMLNTAIALGLGELELVYPVGSLDKIKRTKKMFLKDIKNKFKISYFEGRLKKLRARD